MRSILFIALAFLLVASNGYTQQFDWAYEASGVGLDAGRAVCTDLDGNVIIVGSFAGNATFGDTTLNGFGDPDGFVGKFTSNGEQLWMRLISGPSEDLARGVTTDHLGNIFVTGHFTDSAYFSITATDTIKMVSAGKQDVFIAKYTPDGTIIWVRNAGGSEDDTGTDIAWHQDGKLLISGGFEGRATFANVSMLSIGLSDAFLLAMDGDGGSLWVKRGGGPAHDVAASVAFDKVSGHIYIAGDFFETALFGTTTLQATGSSDMFLAKYNLQGDLLWANTNGSTNLDVASTVGCDWQGNVFVAGHYQGVTQFGDVFSASLGYNDVFVAKFNGDGALQWLRSMGGTDLETCQGMAVDWDGTTYITGMFDTRLISSQDTLEGNGYDIFIACLEPSGHTRYLKSAGGTSADIPMGICLGQGQSLFITGFFYFFSYFDNLTIGNAINGDVFLARLTDIVGINEDVVWNATECLRFNSAQSSMQLDCDLTGAYQVFDLSGRVVMTGSTTQSHVQLNGLPSGYYIFSMNDKKQRAVLPFVVF